MLLVSLVSCISPSEKQLWTCRCCLHSHNTDWWWVGTEFCLVLNEFVRMDLHSPGRNDLQYQHSNVGCGVNNKITSGCMFLLDSLISLFPADGVALGAAASTSQTSVQLIVFVAIMLHKVKLNIYWSQCCCRIVRLCAQWFGCWDGKVSKLCCCLVHRLLRLLVWYRSWCMLVLRGIASANTC